MLGTPTDCDIQLEDADDDGAVDHICSKGDHFQFEGCFCASCSGYCLEIHMSSNVQDARRCHYDDGRDRGFDELWDVGVYSCDRFRKYADQRYHYAEDAIGYLENPLYQRHHFFCVSFSDHIADQGAACGRECREYNPHEAGDASCDVGYCKCPFTEMFDVEEEYEPGRDGDSVLDHGP